MNKLGFINYIGDQISLHATMSDRTSRSVCDITPIVSFAVTPPLSSFEFMDMYIKTNSKPNSVTIRNYNSTILVSVVAADIKDYGDDLYYLKIPRSTVVDTRASTKVITGMIYVDIEYNKSNIDENTFLSYVKTGYLEPIS